LQHGHENPGEAFGALDAYALVVCRWAEGLGFDPNTYPAFRDLALRAYERQGVRQALVREQQTPKFFDQTETANARSG
jgi:glutathione S-transferase